MSNKNYFGTCTECGEENCELTVVDELNHVCEDCLDNEYIECEECNEYWKWDAIKFFNLKDGRTLLALRYKETVQLKGRNLLSAPYEVPDYEGKLLPFWYMALVIIGIIAFSLLVPLGGLLLFPNFRLKQKGSGLKWFGMATIFPLATIVPFFIPNLATDTDIISTLILPVQLAGAAILYVLVAVIQRRRSKSARATAYIKQ